MPENETRQIAKTLKLAAMDFALAPLETIRKELGVTSNAIYQRRQTELYKTTVEELHQAWKEKMLQTPGTTELRKQINYGLGIAVKKLVTILSSSKTTNKDVVSAARLMAQMDGRFLGHDAEEARAQGGADVDSVATELIQMIQRTRGDSIQ